MFLLFFLLWVVFNGKINLEIAGFGLVISAAMYYFICRYMGYSPKKDRVIVKNFFPGLLFCVCLVWEILKANVNVMKMIYWVKIETEPVIVSIRTSLSSELARVALANAITLTPGTITATLEGNVLVIHCLDKSLAEGMEDSIFVKLLMHMERNASF